MANLNTVDDGALEEDSIRKAARIYSIRCRHCRTFLLQSNKVNIAHERSTDLCGNCLYLDEDDLPSWIKDEIASSGWTKGRIYCPKQGCPARVGGFDFVQGVLCNCGVFTIPAIWIQDGKVDVNIISGDGNPLLKNAQPKSGKLHNFSTQLQGDEPVFNSSEMPGLKKASNALAAKEIVLSGPGKSALPGLSACQNLDDFGTPVINRVPLATSADAVVLPNRVTTCAPAATRRLKKHGSYVVDGSKTRESGKNSKSYGIPSATCPPSKNLSPGNRFTNLKIEEPKVIKSPKIDVVDDHLTCPVCLDCFYKPFECPCSHVFCEPCLRQLYHARSGPLSCPVCRSPVRYIEPANTLREELRKFHGKLVKAREAFERNAKYKTWPLPPLGPLPFLKKRPPFVPAQDKRLVKLAGLLLLIVCCSILYISGSNFY